MDLQREKQAVAAAAVARVATGCRLGLGSGSTLEVFIPLLAARVRAGLRLSCVATSERIAALARAQGLPLVELGADPLDLAIDGADEVDPRGRLIKGAGGAMVRERIVAAAAAHFLVLIDSSKLVSHLGARMPLPVEIQTFGVAQTQRRVADLLGQAPLRVRDGRPVITDNQGYLLDCPLSAGADAQALTAALRAIPGVVDSGFFLGFRPEILVARNGAVEAIRFTG